MPSELTRRGLLAVLAAAGPAGAALSDAGEYFDIAAPLSGSAWRATGRVPDTVESPYGEATVTYDEYHVPHVEAGDEAAAYFAVGYAQAADRLPEMDLFRRRAGGTLAALVGEQGVENDVFATKMDFRGAAEASRETVAGTDAERMAEAYADGVNAFVDAGSPGVEYGLLGADPEPWSVVDTLLVAVQMGWLLCGGFDSLREEVKRETLDAETRDLLYPDRLDHDVPIVRPDQTGGEAQGVGGEPASPDESQSLDPEFVDWLSGFEGPDAAGSNAWTVSGDLTESGDPILCSDPHLQLQAPPLWYQQHVTAGDVDVRGAAVVGVPFVVIGETDFCAWGITNVGVQTVDCYTYETDGDRYRYRGEWREFETETRTVEVDGGADRDVEVRKTVHGPYLKREVDGEERSVGVAWTGLTGTREAEAIHEFSRATSLEEFRAAARKFDLPTQNLHYADREGNTLYQQVGQIPIRRVDGEVIRSARVFDGSAGEAEWDGFDPYGQSTWKGFVPFDERPSLVNPDYVASANQRVADDPTYPLAESFSSGFRAIRIYEVLDEVAASGDAVDAAAMQALQTDALSVPARMLVPAILDARDRMPADADPWLDALDGWDYRMKRDSVAALAFAHFFDHFREATWEPFFEDRDLSSTFWPQDWVLLTLPADSEVFDGDRAGVLAEAMERTVEDLAEADWETYGDYNVTALDHPFGFLVPGLNYERHPTDGSPSTVRMYSKSGDWGASYRLVSRQGGESFDVLPGGNDGSVFSDHYEDQLPLWADGEYRRLGEGTSGETDVTIEEDDR